MILYSPELTLKPVLRPIRRPDYLDNAPLLSDGLVEPPSLCIGRGEGVAGSGVVQQTHCLLCQANCFIAVSPISVSRGRKYPGLVVKGHAFVGEG